MPYLWILLGVLALYLYLRDRVKNKKLYELSANLPGPKSWPILGSSLEFASDTEGIFQKMTSFSEKYGRYYKLWNNGKLFVILSDCRDVETILSDNVNLTKSDIYKFIIPWIGNGLLTATGKKWKLHRRVITPTFFFKILEDFLDVFNKNGKVFCECLEVEAGQKPFNMFNYFNRAALDNILESAMGVYLDVQRTKDSRYLKAIKDICATATLRMFKVWYMIEFLFKISPHYKVQKEAIDYIHDFTYKLIRQKRESLKNKTEAPEKQAELKTMDQYDDDDGFSKERKALLDLLLEHAGTQLTDEEICDEVNTFTFEGHDSVSSTLSFCCYEIANNPDVQEKIYEEQMKVMGDRKADLTMRKISEMQYLEQVIKETLRLYPAVTFTGREIDQDLQLRDGPLLPKGTNVFINAYSLHRDPKIWSNPDKFDPDNFRPDRDRRHPFAFVPFSGGSRNCIGQKFAMLEMKTNISHLIRNYKLFPSPDPLHKLKLVNELVLISKTGQMMSVEKRN